MVGSPLDTVPYPCSGQIEVVSLLHPSYILLLILALLPLAVPLPITPRYLTLASFARLLHQSSLTFTRVRVITPCKYIDSVH